ncbi:hypothetical protein LTR67_003952 [Exophiala xenobiotica]
MAVTKQLITNVRLFDGNDVVGESMAVLINGTLIAGIYNTSDQPTVGADAEIIDGIGMTLLPGLIDAHTHTRRPWGEHAILFGVTTEVDMMSFPEEMLPLRKEAAEHMNMSAVKSSSISCTVPGGWPCPLVEPFIRERVKAERADIIKLLVDTRKWHDGLPTMDMEMVDAIVRVAHSYNRLAVCHIHEHAAAVEVVRHGVDALAHLFLDEPHSTEFVALCKEKGIFVIATFGLLGSLSGSCLSEEISNHPQVLRFASPGSISALRRDGTSIGYHKSKNKNVQWAWDAARALHQADVPVLAGSDCIRDQTNGAVHGVSVHHEMWMLADHCGFTPREALQSATGKTAKAYGWTDRGTIEVGKLADLVLVAGDPTSDIRKSLDIKEVWRQGQRLDREKARAKVKEFASDPIANSVW